MNLNENVAASAVIGCPVATAGELFTDGAMIELIGGDRSAPLQLMLWDGSKEIIGPVVEYDGKLFEPVQIGSSILRQLMLPTRCYPHGNTREFLTEICKLIENLVGLDEKSASLAARNVLCSAIVDTVSVAPAIAITGPDTGRANRFVSLLRCLCWHSVPSCAATRSRFGHPRAREPGEPRSQSAGMMQEEG